MFWITVVLIIIYRKIHSFKKAFFREAERTEKRHQELVNAIKYGERKDSK